MAFIRNKCPFCGSGDIGYLGTLKVGYYAYCRSCNSTGPTLPDIPSADTNFCNPTAYNSDIIEAFKKLIKK